eukprot:gene13161-15540_t
MGLSSDAAMMPWATYRHTLECYWASSLTVGAVLQAAVSKDFTFYSKKQLELQRLLDEERERAAQLKKQYSETEAQLKNLADGLQQTKSPAVDLPQATHLLGDLDDRLDSKIEREACDVEKAREAFPSGSLIELSGNQFLKDGQFLNVPGNTTLLLPHCEDGLLSATVPSQSEVLFSEGRCTGTVSVPGGTSITLPEGPDAEDIYTITIPPSTRVVPPLDDKDVCGNVLTESVFFAAPADVAKRIIMYGTDCAAIALGGMGTHLAAEVMNCGVLNAKRVTEILRETKLEAAYRVIQRLQPAVLKAVMPTLSSSRVGAILSLATPPDQDALIKEAALGSVDAMRITQQARAFVQCKALLSQPEFRPWKTTYKMLELEPAVAARLMATSSSSRCAAVISNISSMDLPKATEHMEALHDIARRIEALGESHKSKDVITSRLVQALADARSERQLFDMAGELLTHFSKSYGVGCTLSRESTRKVERKQNIVEEARLEMEELDDCMSPEVFEELVDEKMEILLSLEDIKFGTSFTGASASMKV